MVDMSIILLMASANKLAVTRSAARTSDHIACKVDTLRAAQKLLAKPSGFAETMVCVWIVGCLMNVEASGPRLTLSRVSCDVWTLAANALRQRAYGDIKAARTHAKGLFAMRQQPNSPVSPKVWGYMERTFLM